MSTGPSMLLQPDEDRSEDTGTFISRSAAQHWAEVQAAAAHPHRTPRLLDRIRDRFRGHGEVPSVPAEEDGGDEEGEFTGIVDSYRPEPLPFRTSALARARSVDEPRETRADMPTQAIPAADLADDLITDVPPEPRRFVPPPASAVPWAIWDTPLNREPMQSLACHVASELTDLPLFRATLAASAANARECLFGCRIDEDSWGERMVSAGVTMLTVWDLWVVRMLDALPPAAVEARQEAAA
jgi:hypothetical protein